MSKEPVKRKRSMYAKDGVDTSKGSVSKPIVDDHFDLPEVQPMLCHGTPLLNQEIQPMLCHGRGVFNQEKSVTGTMQKSPPRKNRAFVPSGDKKGFERPEWVGILKRLGVTMTEFGKLWGVPPSTYKDWARGADPTPAWVWRAVMLMADPEVMRRLKKYAAGADHGND